ncbi:MAG: amidohydrolase family protein, partial [Micrococcales bacterium]|nr:amidohydrolase family protein [Micrococcales bacterium]
AGASLALGSDAPVAPLDPWIAIGAAVLRARDARAPWHPEQRITLAEALEASVRSRVAVGEPADLAVLDADPARTARDEDAAALRSTPVAGTLLGGEWIHHAL